MGINTFFTGSQAGSIGVNNTVLQDPTKFAASSQGVGTDTTNAQTLAGFLTLPLASQNGATIQTLYNNITAGVTQNSANATASANAADTLQSTLSSQETAVSGVNIDDEVVEHDELSAGLPGLGKIYFHLERPADHAGPVVGSRP